jgi:hemoglobin/transferrin/lactoferrin receptor protein
MRYMSLLAVWMLPLCVSGQNKEGAGKDTSQYLHPVVVTATRKLTEGYLLPYSYTSLDSQKISQSGARTTPELLMGTAGVFVQKTNHGGGSAFIRGLTGNQTLILVDGIRFNNSTFRYGPNQYLNTIDLYTIDKVEVVKGAGSVQYGSDALGGVIQLFSRDPDFGTNGFKTKAIAKTISADMEYTGRGELSYRSSGFVFSAGYTQRKFGDLVGGDSTGRQSPSGYTERSFDAKMKFRLGNNTTVSMSHQYTRQENVPLYHRVKLENYAYYFFSPQQRSMSYLKLESKTNKRWMESVSLILSYQQSFEKRDYLRNGNANRFSEEDRVKTIGATVDVFSRWTKNWNSNSGIEYYYDKVNSAKYQYPVNGAAMLLLRGLYPDGATNQNFSLYSLHHLQVGKFNIEGGVRYNLLNIQITDTSKTPGSLGKVNVTPSSLVTNAALGYQLNKQSGLFISFSTGYRAPNIDDMGTLGLVDFRYEVPAYGLKPEKSYHTELGYRFRNQQFSASVAVFYMHLSNLITRVQVPGQQVNGYNVYTKVNSQESYLRGAEWDGRYQLSARFSFEMNATYLFGQNLSAQEPMRRIPPLNGRAQLRYQQQQWYVAIENMVAARQNRLAQGDKDDNRIPAGGTPGWNLTNLHAGHSGKVFSIKGGIQNIGNIDYRTHGSGINGAGRNVWVSVEMKL